MKNRISILVLLASFILISSCQKTSDLLNIADSFTLKRNGAYMPVYVHGNVTSDIFVLTLGGGPGDPGLAFRTGGWSDMMEERYAMVYWDQRGSGMAQGTLDADNFNFEEMQIDTEALVALLKHKYGDDITLFLLGHSWGSMLGNGVLSKNNNQQLFNGWINGGSTLGWCQLIADLPAAYTTIANEQIADGKDVAYWESLLLDVADVDTNDCEDYSLNAEAAKATDKLQDNGVIKPNNASAAYSGFIVNNFITTTLQKSASNDFLFELDDFKFLDLTDRIKDITIPSLVMHGKYDLNVALKSGQDYFNTLGSDDKYFVQFESSGHVMFQTETFKYGDEVISFIEAYK